MRAVNGFILFTEEKDKTVSFTGIQYEDDKSSINPVIKGRVIYDGMGTDNRNGLEENIGKFDIFYAMRVECVKLNETTYAVEVEKIISVEDKNDE